MIEKSIKERLSSLEGKMEVLLELLREISEDNKEQPSREEFLDLQNRVNTMFIKVGIVVGILGSIGGAALTLLLKYILKVL